MGLDDNFSWDNVEFAEGDTMFGQTPQTVGDDSIVEEILGDDLPGDKGGKQPETPLPGDTPKPTKEELEAFSDFEKGSSEDEEEEFEEEENEEQPEDKKKPGRKAAPVKISSKSTLEFLKEKGFVEFELEEGKELTDAEADDILEDNWESSIEKGVEESIKELPDEVKALIKVAVAGGDVMQLMAKLAVTISTGITKTTDMTQESNQILVMTETLKEQGYDAEDISTQIEFLKNSGKLETMSLKAFNKKIEKQALTASEEAARALTAKENSKKQQREYRDAVTSHISSLTELKGLSINKKDKQELPAYMSEPSVELKDGRFITPMQFAYFKAVADKDKSVLLAKILKDDFDFSSIANNKETQVTREKREKLEAVNKTGSNGSSRSTPRVIKTVADYLD